MDTKHANVQRKLEFPVRKSTRSTRAKHQNRSKTESPRKRCSDGKIKHYAFVDPISTIKGEICLSM